MKQIATEADLEALVADSIKSAILHANDIISRRPYPNSVARSEKIGLFVTSLRTALVYQVTVRTLSSAMTMPYERAKNELLKTENWSDIGVWGQTPIQWIEHASGRMKRVRIFDRPGFQDVNDLQNSTIQGFPMDKTRIGQVAAQVKENTDGFNFDASFASMEQTIKDMRRMAAQHETLSGQATQVTESLCAVAESLTLDTNMTGAM